MIDIHCHILPAVDDGAAGMAEAVAMGRMAAADGVEVMIATPHLRREPWPNLSRVDIERRIAELERELAGDGPRLLPGGEVAVDSDLLGELLERPPGSVVTLAGSRYLLLEFSPWPLGIDPVAVVHELGVAGWRPVIGHPERVPWLAEDRQLLAATVAAGGLLQVTALSVTGGFGRRVQACCEFLIDHGLAHFVASDAHGVTARPPVLSAAERWICQVWGEETAVRLMRRNPAAVLADQPLSERKEQVS